MNVDTPAQKAMTKARTALVLHQPFFGALSLRMDLIEDARVPTACVNGRAIRYNPQFVMSLTDRQRVFLVAHEVMHPAMKHHCRRGNRDPFLANVAMDFAINPVLVDSGFELIPGALHDKQYDGMNFEAIYPRIQQEAKKALEEMIKAGQVGWCDDAPGSGNSDDKSDGKSGACSPAEMAAEERDWQIAVEQAARAAQMQGLLPGSLQRLIDENKTPQIDWREVLRRFVIAALQNADYRWCPPNRRFIAGGLYLPSAAKEGCAAIDVIGDTSGSIGGPILNAFAAEMRSIHEEMRPELTRVIWADAAVAGVDEFGPYDDLTFDPKGGGGTDFRLAFDWITEQEKQPACAVYLTDLYGTFPDRAPEYPVLWVSVTKDQSAPWGETVYIEVS